MSKYGASDNVKAMVELVPIDDEEFIGEVCESSDTDISLSQDSPDTEALSPEIWGDPIEPYLPSSPEVWGDSEGMPSLQSPVVWSNSEYLPDVMSSAVIWADCDSSSELHSEEVWYGPADESRTRSPKVCEYEDASCEPGPDVVCEDKFVTCELYSPEICEDAEVFDGECELLSPKGCGQSDETIESLSLEIFEEISSKYDDCSLEVGSNGPSIVDQHSLGMVENPQNICESHSPQVSGDLESNEIMEKIYSEDQGIPCAERVPAEESRQCQVTSGGPVDKRKKYSDKKLNWEPIVALERLKRNVVMKEKASVATVTSNAEVAEEKNAAVGIGSLNTQTDNNKNEEMDIEEQKIEECNESRVVSDGNSSTSFNSTHHDEAGTKGSEEKIMEPLIEPFNDGSDGEETITEVITDGRTDSEYSDVDTSTTDEIETFHLNHEEHVYKKSASNETEKSETCIPATTSRVVGRILEALVAPTNQSGQLQWIVKFQDNQNLDLVSAELIHECFPQSVIRYLERRLHFEPAKSSGMTIKLLQSYSKRRLYKSASK